MANATHLMVSSEATASTTDGDADGDAELPIN